MIYFTGDVHGDRHRLSKSELGMLKPGDTLIICGDFGFLWDNRKSEIKFLNHLGMRKYNICFVDGIHENFDLLSDLPVVMWNGGKAHLIHDNVYHLMRGQIFNIEGKTIFTMGGGEDPEEEPSDYDNEIHKETPSAAEMLSAAKMLESVNYKVDYIVTHEPPAKTRDFMLLSSNKTLRVTALGAFFDGLSGQADFKKWYFGSMHTDKHISDSQVSLFTSIEKAY